MMFDDLNTLVDTIFSTLTQIFNLYTSSIVLSGVLALWLLRKAIKVFKHL